MGAHASLHCCDTPCPLHFFDTLRGALSFPSGVFSTFREATAVPARRRLPNGFRIGHDLDRSRGKLALPERSPLFVRGEERWKTDQIVQNIFDKIIECRWIRRGR